MYPDVPWQIDVLIAEAVVSVLLASWYIFRGWQPTLGGAILGVLWNVAVFALILWGGSPTWQHVAYTVLNAWALCASLGRVSTLKPVKPADNPSSATFGGVLITAGMLYLLIGGTA